MYLEFMIFGVLYLCKQVANGRD